MEGAGPALTDVVSAGGIAGVLEDAMQRPDPKVGAKPGPIPARLFRKALWVESDTGFLTAPYTSYSRKGNTMKFVRTFLAAVAGIAVGFALGAIAAGLFAPLIGIRSFEGEAGYFAVFIGGPVGAIVGILIAGVVALRLAGYQRLEAILLRLGLIVLAVVALGATTAGVLWLIRPIANTNGAAPQLVFEIRLPPGAAAPTVSPSPVEL